MQFGQTAPNHSRPFSQESDRQAPRVAAGQVRVLVVGDSGVGKSSLVHLIAAGKPTRRPEKTVGCNVSLKFVEHADRLAVHDGATLARSELSGRGEGFLAREGEKRSGYFVELWDVSGNEEYKSSRSIFYSQINGVIFVHDLSRKKSRMSALGWLAEVASSGTFSAPSNPRRPGLLPVPLLVIGNKGDICEKDPVQKSATRLWQAMQGNRNVRAARNWAERNRLLGFGSQQDLPDYIRNPNAAGLVACAKEGRLDMRAVTAFFRDLIERRYFMEHMPPLPSPSKSWNNPYFSPSAASSAKASPVFARTSDLGLDPAQLLTKRGKQVEFGRTGVVGSSHEWTNGVQHVVSIDSLATASQTSMDSELTSALASREGSAGPAGAPGVPLTMPIGYTSSWESFADPLGDSTPRSMQAASSPGFSEPNVGPQPLTTAATWAGQFSDQPSIAVPVVTGGLGASLDAAVEPASSGSHAVEYEAELRQALGAEASAGAERLPDSCLPKGAAWPESLRYRDGPGASAETPPPGSVAASPICTHPKDQPNWGSDLATSGLGPKKQDDDRASADASGIQGCQTSAKSVNGSLVNTRP